jgi:flagellar L-ring protein FlgH
MLRLILISLIFLTIIPKTITSDSLWDYARTPIYGTSKREVQVGDIITVKITESTSAVQEASTRTGKTSKIGTDILSNWDQIASIMGSETLRKRQEFELEGEDQYRGTGQTSRKSKVTAIITAIVTEILESGNIYIIGDHQVKINNELETIHIAGIIRPEDIAPDNSVESFQIAKAEVSVIGAGVIGAKQSPGVLTKMFNWFF